MTVTQLVTYVLAIACFAAGGLSILAHSATVFGAPRHQRVVITACMMLIAGIYIAVIVWLALQAGVAAN